jgi:hypothetical protein
MKEVQIFIGGANKTQRKSKIQRAKRHLQHTKPEFKAQKPSSHDIETITSRPKPKRSKPKRSKPKTKPQITQSSGTKLPSKKGTGEINMNVPKYTALMNMERLPRDMYKILFWSPGNMNLIDGSTVVTKQMIKLLSKLENSIIFFLLPSNIDSSGWFPDELKNSENIRIIEPKLLGLECLTEGRTWIQVVNRLYQIYVFDRMIVRSLGLWKNYLPSLMNLSFRHKIDVFVQSCMFDQYEPIVLQQLFNEFGTLLASSPLVKQKIELSESSQVFLPVIEKTYDEPSNSFPTNVLKICYAGKFREEYRIRDLISAFSLIQKDLREHPDEWNEITSVEFHIFGDNFRYQKASEHSAVIHRINRTPGIVFHGGVEHSKLLELLPEYHFCLSYRDFNDCLDVSSKVLEFASLGIPILMNQTSINEHLFGSSYPGYVSDVFEIMHAVKKMVRYPESYQLAQKCCLGAVDEFTHEKTLSCLQERCIKRKRITFIAYLDCANVLTEWSRAVNRFSSEYESLSICGHVHRFMYELKHDYDLRDVRTEETKRFLRDWILGSEQIICGFERVKRGVYILGLISDFLGVDLKRLRRKIKLHVFHAGSLYRSAPKHFNKDVHRIFQKKIYAPDLYRLSQKNTDDYLFWPFYTGNLFETIDQLLIPKLHREKLLILHCPSNMDLKGSHKVKQIVESVLSELPENLFEFMATEPPIDHENIIALKRKSIIYIDQFTPKKISTFGMSSIEALSYGNIILSSRSNIGEEFFEHNDLDVDNFPVCDLQTERQFYDILLNLCLKTRDELWEMSRNNIKWYRDKLGPQRFCRLFEHKILLPEETNED